jgi:hypothetical protein
MNMKLRPFVVFAALLFRMVSVAAGPSPDAIEMREEDCCLVCCRKFMTERGPIFYQI